ncbi:MAG: hypothetical protein AAF849_09070 [Bacteroidota bacterium]
MKLPLLFLFLLPFLLQAQNIQAPLAGARGAAMGGSGVIFGDINSAFSNQAGLTQLDQMAAMVFAERRFLASPINHIAAAFAYPSGFGTLGFSINSFGVENYQEQKIGLIYARQLLEGLSIGAQFDYFNVNIPLYGNRGAITFELGLQAQLLKKLSFGFHLYSPARIELVSDAVLPSIYKAGIGYTPSDKVLLTAEVEKDIDYPTRFRGGLEYAFSAIFFFRAGFATQPTLVSLGMGLQLKSALVIDVAASYHQILGVSPSVGVAYKF